jgi:hypothetical protein
MAARCRTRVEVEASLCRLKVAHARRSMVQARSDETLSSCSIQSSSERMPETPWCERRASISGRMRGTSSGVAGRRGMGEGTNPGEGETWRDFRELREQHLKVRSVVIAYVIVHPSRRREAFDPGHSRWIHCCPANAEREWLLAVHVVLPSVAFCSDDCVGNSD